MIVRNFYIREKNNKMMIRVGSIRKLVQEIIELSSKSPILADSKSNTFCKQYRELNAIDEKNREAKFQFLVSLTNGYGIKSANLFSNVIFV